MSTKNQINQIMVVSRKGSGRVLAAVTIGGPPGCGVWSTTRERVKFEYNLTEDDIVITYLWSSMAQPEVFLP